MKEEIIKALKIAAVGCCGSEASVWTVKLDYPENPEHGDFSSNLAMANAKILRIAPKVLAEKIIVEFKKNMPDFVCDLSVAGPGFINFFVKNEMNMASQKKKIAVIS